MKPRFIKILVALLILAGVGVLLDIGPSSFQSTATHAAKARYVKAQWSLRMVSEGLESYRMKHGAYPMHENFQSMVDANSPLRKEGLISNFVTPIDSLGQPFSGSSSASTYKLECKGDSQNPKAFPSFIVTPRAP